MEKHPNPFDEFLKETLKGHQLAPPEEAKEAFLREAGAILQSRKGFKRWYYLPALVAVLIGLFSVFYILNNHEISTSKHIINEQVNSTAGLTSNPASTPNLKSTSNSVQVINPKAGLISTSISSINSDNGTKPPVTMITPSSETRLISYEAGESIMSASSEGGISAKNDTLISKTKASKLALDSLANPGVSNAAPVTQGQTASHDTVTVAMPATTAGADIPERGKSENYFMAGVYYLPEWVFNTFNGNKFIYNVGIEGTYNFGPLSVQTGVGIAVSNDVTKIAVEYNDYLGSYNKLDSMSFTFNEQTHNFTPDYFMSSEKVYDTLPLMDYPEYKMRYTYLRIPLVIGYDFWSKGRFSLGVRLGTALSLLLNSKQLSEVYNPGQNKVTNVYKITPDYVSVNWQVTGGMNASLRLMDHFYFELEPIGMYFYNSVYESPGSTKKPFAVGFRTAVLYKF
jgi:hypothetical protein